MNTWVIAHLVIAACACVLVLGAAWRSRGIVAELVRAARFAGLSIPFVSSRVRTGRIEPAGPIFDAPFTHRAVLFARAELHGPRPDDNAVSVLWQRTRCAPCKLVAADEQIDLALEKMLVLTAREYRHGMLRALLDDVPSLPKYLSRAGYTSPPASKTWFMLDEQVVRPGDRVVVLFARDGTPSLLSTLPGWKLALRLAWGPILAALFALAMAATAFVVFAVWSWTR